MSRGIVRRVRVTGLVPVTALGDRAIRGEIEMIWHIGPRWFLLSTIERIIPLRECLKAAQLVGNTSLRLLRLAGVMDRKPRDRMRFHRQHRSVRAPVCAADILDLRGNDARVGVPGTSERECREGDCERTGQYVRHVLE